MSALSDENVIKLHTDAAGHVWYAKGVNAAVNSGLSVDVFLRSPPAAGMGLTFRLLGVKQNAELICSLYLRRHKGEVRSVEVAGPNILREPTDLDTPALVLQQMRTAASSPACGGWHQVTMHDYPTYAMLARMARTNYAFDESAESYLRMHPAYKALTFIPTLVDENAAKTLITVVDPRWYVDRRRPNRIKKLELFLGLTPRVQVLVSQRKKLLTKTRQFRCATLLASWKSKAFDEVDLKDPANFLYRVYQAAGGGDRGDLRASQAFLRYLNDNWLAGLENRKGKRDGLFAEDLFFKSPAEVESYVAHMSATKK